MTVHSLKSEAIERGSRMLRTALGPDVAAWLADRAVVEVMLNPDGWLRVDRLGGGLSDTMRDAAQATGRERYEGFVEALGRRLAKGTTLTKKVLEERNV